MAGLSGMRTWSVNTWLIAICVGVFVIDGLMPRREPFYRPMVVATDVPHYVNIVGGEEYKEITNPPAEQASLRSPGYFVRPVVDTAAGEHIGSVMYHWMPPLKRFGYFSTDLAFRGLQLWRFFGFQFLHASLLHLLFNMVVLYFFGSLVEQHLGRKRYLAFYLLCGLCGALMYLVLNLGGYVLSMYTEDPVRIPGLLFNSPAQPLIGASAGVFGVVMAGAYLAPRAIVLLFFVIPMRLATLAYAFVGLALVSLIMGRPNAGGEAGHLGGAIAGFYFIRHPQHLHGFFDFVGWADPTSHHYRDKGRRAGPSRPGRRTEIDRILDKIKQGGLQNLTAREKRLLREASERD